MKVLIAFLICVVAASGKQRPLNDYEKKMFDKFKDAIDICKQEMKEDPVYKDVKLTQHPCFRSCVDKKIGVMNEDGSYNLERILSLADTPLEREQAVKVYNREIVKCMLEHKDHCKITECIYKKPKSKDINDRLMLFTV